MAGVVDGQPVSAAVTNPAFIIKNADDTTPSKLGFANTAPESGGSITSGQQEFNSIDSFIGKIANTAATATPAWTHNEIGASTDSLFTRLNAVTQKFDATVVNGGHGHTGVNGDGPQLATGSISNNPAAPQDVADISSVGTSGNFAWDNHVHRGLHSIAVSGSTVIYGDATLTGDSSISLTQSGQNIQISAVGAAQTNFTLTNGEATPTNITGMVLDHTIHAGALIKTMIIQSTATAELVSMGWIHLFWRPETLVWDLLATWVGDDPGIALTATTGGQVQYTLGTLAGTGYSGVLKYKMDSFTA